MSHTAASRSTPVEEAASAGETASSCESIRWLAEANSFLWALSRACSACEQIARSSRRSPSSGRRPSSRSVHRQEAERRARSIGRDTQNSPSWERHGVGVVAVGQVGRVDVLEVRPEVGFMRRRRPRAARTGCGEPPPARSACRRCPLQCVAALLRSDHQHDLVVIHAGRRGHDHGCETGDRPHRLGRVETRATAASSRALRASSVEYLGA